MEEEGILPTHSLRPALRWCQNLTKTWQTGKQQDNIPDEIPGCKTLYKILPNLIQQYFKWIIYDNQLGFILGMQGWFSIHKSMWYTTSTKHMIKIMIILRVPQWLSWLSVQFLILAQVMILQFCEFRLCADYVEPTWD